MTATTAPTPTPSTTSTTALSSIIWGKLSMVLAIAEASGATPVTTVYNDGQRVTSPVVGFQGGYDDYNGSAAWAEVPGEFSGQVTRFSPSPGRWMSGVRVG